jgi:Domain of unknown function (DUF5615)
LRARLLADGDLRVAILQGFLRREPRANFLPAQETIAEGMGDPLVLALAADLDRVLVSHDLRSMPEHFYRFVGSRESPGLILIRQRMPIGAPIEDLRLVWTRLDADDFRNQITYLPLTYSRRSSLEAI